MTAPDVRLDDVEVVREALSDLYFYTADRRGNRGRSDIHQHALAALARLQERLEAAQRIFGRHLEGWDIREDARDFLARPAPEERRR